MKHVVLFTVYPTPLSQSFCAFTLFHSLLYLYGVWYISRVSKNISWMKVKRVGLKSLPPKCVWPFPSPSWRCPGISDAFLPVIWHSVRARSNILFLPSSPHCRMPLWSCMVPACGLCLISPGCLWRHCSVWPWWELASPWVPIWAISEVHRPATNTYAKGSLKQ